MPQIRRFQNADLPDLVRLWTHHFESQGCQLEATVTPAVFEQAILNRIFFDAEGLLIATDGPGGETLGFAHWLENTREPSAANIVSICAAPRADGEAVSRALIAACEARMRAAGKSVCYGGAQRLDLTGYAGLPPLGPGEGVPDQDQLAVGWYYQAGFSPYRRLTRYRVPLTTFRPPVDRSQIMLRRSLLVGSRLELPQSWRRAAALSHVDAERFTAKTRGGETVAWAELLIGDPEAQVLPLQTAILDRWESESTFDPHDATRFVIAAALKELADRRMKFVDAVADDQHPDRARLLRSLPFEADGEGTVFAKQLTSAPAG